MTFPTVFRWECVYMVEGGIEGNIAETVPQSHCFACIFQELSAKDWAKGGTSMKNKNAGCVYGYVRVSSADQNEERQRIAMAQEGLKEKDIFMDKQSGKDFERPAYLKLLKKLKEGDLLLIESIDRLGRNYEEIIEQWRHITKVIRADIRVLDMPLLDTTISKDLLGTFIADLVLQVLSFAAENERKNIRQRQREGIDAALARGVHFGRPGIPDSEAMLEAVRLYRQKKISLSRALDMSGIGRTTFYKKLKEFSA